MNITQLLGQPQAVATLVGFVVPLVVGLVTKWSAPRGLKSAINALLSGLGGGLSAWLLAPPGSRVSWEAEVTTIGFTWAISIASHYGLWKPTGIANAIASIAPGFGLGGPVIPVPSVPVPGAGVATLSVGAAPGITLVASGSVNVYYGSSDAPPPPPETTPPASAS